MRTMYLCAGTQFSITYLKLKYKCRVHCTDNSVVQFCCFRMAWCLLLGSFFLNVVVDVLNSAGVRPVWTKGSLGVGLLMMMI